nr:monoglyceride lipase-like [Ipomoea batatas]
MVCLAIHELYVIRIRSLRFRGKLGSVSRLSSRAGDPARYLFSGLRVFAFPKPMAVELSKGNDARATIILTSGASGRISALFSMQALRSLWLLLNAFVLLFLIPFRGRRRMASAASVATSASQEKGVGKEEKATERKGAIVRVPTTMLSRKSAVEQEVAARRALAMRRVMQDDDDETVRECSLFVTPRGDTLFTQSWTPVSVKLDIQSVVPLDEPQFKNHNAQIPFKAFEDDCCSCFACQGLVIILHGLNEHSGRYNDFAKKLNANGFKVYGMDWIGHGGSDGLHAFVHSLDDAVNDTKLFLSKVLVDNNPGLPCFLFGHSTGGAIVLKTALDPKVSTLISGIVLTSPAVGVQPAHPVVTALAPVLSLLMPRYEWRTGNKRGISVSRDPEALVAKYSDPLVFTGSIRVRTGYEILRITTFLQNNLSRLTVPFLVLHGTADLVTHPEASKKLYEDASSTDKTIKLFQGLLHDLLFEPEKEQVANHIIQWLDQRS